MTYPWEAVAVPAPQPDSSGFRYEVRPELIRDPITGLYPGERNGIPGFLRRVRMPDGSVRIGVENA